MPLLSFHATRHLVSRIFSFSIFSILNALTTLQKKTQFQAPFIWSTARFIARYHNRQHDDEAAHYAADDLCDATSRDFDEFGEQLVGGRCRRDSLFYLRGTHDDVGY